MVLEPDPAAGAAPAIGAGVVAAGGDQLGHVRLRLRQVVRMDRLGAVGGGELGGRAAQHLVHRGRDVEHAQRVVEADDDVGRALGEQPQLRLARGLRGPGGGEAAATRAQPRLQQPQLRRMPGREHRGQVRLAAQVARLHQQLADRPQQGAVRGPPGAGDAQQPERHRHGDRDAELQVHRGQQLAAAQRHHQQRAPPAGVLQRGVAEHLVHAARVDGFGHARLGRGAIGAQHRVIREALADPALGLDRAGEDLPGLDVDEEDRVLHHLVERMGDLGQPAERQRRAEHADPAARGVEHRHLADDQRHVAQPAARDEGLQALRAVRRHQPHEGGLLRHVQAEAVGERAAGETAGGVGRPQHQLVGAAGGDGLQVAVALRGVERADGEQAAGQGEQGGHLLRGGVLPLGQEARRVERAQLGGLQHRFPLHQRAADHQADQRQHREQHHHPGAHADGSQGSEGAPGAGMQHRR